MEERVFVNFEVMHACTVTSFSAEKDESLGAWLRVNVVIERSFKIVLYIVIICKKEMF